MTQHVARQKAPITPTIDQVMDRMSRGHCGRHDLPLAGFETAFCFRCAKGCEIDAAIVATWLTRDQFEAIVLVGNGGAQ